MAVTLSQIAAVTGLSKPTVTRILGSDSHKFNPETRRRVIEMAARMGYRPNSAARAVGSGRFNCVALLLGYSSARSDLPEGLLRGVHDELAQHNMHLNITRLPDQQLTSNGFVPKVLRENMADGILVNYTHDIPTRMLELIRAHHAPAVWVNSDLPNDCVRPDDVGGARQITEYLLIRGHRRIAYVKFDASNHYSRESRQQGYRQAMAQAGRTPWVVDHQVPGNEHLAVARTLLTGADRATALIVRPEDAATFAVVAASLGLSIPSDVSLACIANRGFSMLGMEMTCVCVPSAVEGAAAVKMIRRKIQEPQALLSPVVVPFEFYPGETVSHRSIPG